MSLLPVTTRAPWRRLLLALGLVALLLGVAAPAAAEAIPVADYWERLTQLQAVVKDAASQPPADRPAMLAAAAEAWAGLTAVRLEDGTVVPVDTGALVAALRAPVPDLPALQTRLTNLAAAHADWPAARHTAQAIDRLQAILSRAEFNWSVAPPNPLAELWERLVNAVLRLLTRLLPTGVSAPLVGDLLSWGLTLLSVLVVAAIVVYALRGLLGGLVREVVLPAEAALEGGDLNPEQAQLQAQRLAGQGDYRTAVRYLYLSALLSLEARGLLRYERTLTNREVLRRLGDHPELAGVLREVVEVFDRVWYGYQPLDAATYSRYAERVAALRQAHS